MLRKIRRQMNKAFTANKSPESGSSSKLNLEALENRLLLDVAGYWSELGYRSGSGGGVSWDSNSDAGETALVTTSDGDSVVFWVEGFYPTVTDEYGIYDTSINLYPVDDPVQGTYNFEGRIHAKQYAGSDLGWWDFSNGSGDTQIAYGSQIDAAAGPDGTIILTGIDTDDMVFVMLWDGDQWLDITTANETTNYASTVNQEITQVQVDEDAADSGGTNQDETEVVTETIVSTASSPSVAVNDAGEIYLTYSVQHPNTDQTEIVVMKYGYTYGDNDVVGAPLANDKGWEELTDEDTGLFGARSDQLTAGVSNSEGNSFDPAIAVDAKGMPVVVWTEAYKSRNTEIFAKAWDGDSWNEIGLNSASLNSSNDNTGISSNSYQDVQPDIAINDDGDIIVSWVCWHNWSSYQTNGQAGIYVKYLPGDDLEGSWRGYNFKITNGATTTNVSSDSGAGIAQGNNVPTGRAGLGWYYDPQITLDDSGNPAISWFGWGSAENKAVDRNFDTEYEEPFFGTFVSYLYNHDNSSATANTFEILFEDYDELNYEWLATSNTANTNVQRVVVNEPDKLTWAPSIYFTDDGELIVSYVQASTTEAGTDHDQEVYVRTWDAVNEAWVEYGLGSDSNGNTIFSDYPTAGILDSDVAYFEFDTDSTNEFDIVAAVPSSDGINLGQMYIYDRYAGSWSDTEPASAGGDDINTIDTDGDGENGFGRVFDIDGEPEIEYDEITNGNPVIAFLDDATGLPYVFEYTISSGWQPVTSSGLVEPVGNADMNAPAGNVDVYDYYSTSRTIFNETGIDIQVGSNGDMLLAYVAIDDNGTTGINQIADDYCYVVTWQYDAASNAWSPADTGTLENDAIQEVTYFANYDGCDFDKVGSVTDGDYTDAGAKEYDYDNMEQWYYWEPGGAGADDDDTVEGGVTSYSDEDIDFGRDTGRLHVWDDYDSDDLMQGAIEFKFTYEEESTVSLSSASIERNIEMEMDGDVIIEFDASLDGMGELASGSLSDSLENMDIYLYLTVNGRIVDTNPNDDLLSTAYFPVGYELTPVAVCQAGELLEMSSFKFDTSELQYSDGSAIDLSTGYNQIGFTAYAKYNTDNDGTASALGVYNEAQSGAVRIDNVVIYQRIVSESRYVSGDLNLKDGVTETFDNTSKAALTADGWAVADVDLAEGQGRTGDFYDDALKAVFTDSTTTTITTQKTVTLEEYGLVRVDFDYKLETDEDFGETDILRLTVSSSDGGTFEIFDITGSSASEGWRTVSIYGSTYDDSGATTVTFTAQVINNDGLADGTANVYIDNVDISASLAIQDAADIDLGDADYDEGNPWVYNEQDTSAYINYTGVNYGYHANSGNDGAGDGAILVNFEGGSTYTNLTQGTGGNAYVAANTFADIGYHFTTGTAAGTVYSYMDIDFSYRIQLDTGDVAAGDYGLVEVYLVEDVDATGVHSGNLDQFDSYTLLTDAANYRYYSDGSGDNNDSGWIEVSNLNTGPLAEETDYIIVFRFAVSESTAAGADSTVFSLDDVSMEFTGYTEWASLETNDTDNGGNNYVGQDLNNDGRADYNFWGDLHASTVNNNLLGIQSEMFTIPDFEQKYTGDATIALRYRWDDATTPTNNIPDIDDIRILIDGVEYDYAAAADQFGALDYDGNINWGNYDRTDPKYTWFRITIPELEAGTHDISIQLVGSTDLWIDNLVIQTTHSSTHTINPIVKLGAVGQDGTRAFMVGATYYSEDMLVYVDGDDTRVLGKHEVGTVHRPNYSSTFLFAGFYHSAIFELNDNNWEIYGDRIAEIGDKAYIGLPNSETFVPVSVLYSLKDFAVGPNQVEWALVSRATTDPVYPSEGDQPDYFVVHYYTLANTPSYYNELTELDLQVWRWDIADYNTGRDQQWINVGLPVDSEDYEDGIYSFFDNGQMVSSANQAPIVVWSNYNLDGTVFGSNGYKWVNGQWEALGSNSDYGSTQNDDYWSATITKELIVDNEGDALLMYSAGHLYAYCIREFVPEIQDSDAVITYDNDGDGVSDDSIDFGLVNNGVRSRKLTITNVGLGDLIVQDISFGGLDDILAGFTITNDPGLGTEASIIPSGSGNTYTYNILFDPSQLGANVRPGTYEGVIVVQTSEGEGSEHEFDSYQEIQVRVEIENNADIVIDDDYFYYDDSTVVNSSYSSNDHDDDDNYPDLNNNGILDEGYNWQIQTVYVRNEGTDVLDISSLVYTGAGFAIQDIRRNGSYLAADSLDANDDGLLDGVVSLAAGEYLAIDVAFIPKESGLYDETIFVVSNDSLNPVIPIRMLGYGLAGGDVEVDVSLNGTQWDTVWRSNASGGADDVDEMINLGSTIWGQSDATPVYVRVTNTGTTTMNIEDIHFQSGTAQIAFGDDAVIDDIDLEPNESYVFTMTFTPDTTLVEDITEDIYYLSESLFILTDALDDSEVVLAVDGYAVPQAPVLQVIDNATGEVVSGWDPEEGWVNKGFVNLGTGSIGSSSFTTSLSLRNIGGQELTVEALSVGYFVGGDTDTRDNYVITPANTYDEVNVEGDFTLEMDGQAHTVIVTYTPSSIGTKKPMLIVDYNWDDIISEVEEQAQVYTELYSVVTDQSISLSDDDGLSNTNLGFGNVGVGGEVTKNIVIANTGSNNSRLAITGWELYVYDADTAQYVLVVDEDSSDEYITSPDSAYSVIASEGQFYITGGSEFTLPITFNPLLADENGLAYPAKLVIYSNDTTQTESSNPNFLVDGDTNSYATEYFITGTAVEAGTIETDIDYYDFGEVKYGKFWYDSEGSAKKLITITNTSDAQVAIANIYSNYEVFSVWYDSTGDGNPNIAGDYRSDSEDDYIILEAGESYTVAVSFYGNQSYFDTDNYDEKPRLIVEYDNYSSDELQEIYVEFDASVSMSQTTQTSSNRIKWSDQDGNIVTILLSGAGSLSVSSVSSSNNNIGQIEVIGSNSYSVLTVIGSYNSTAYIGAIVGEDGDAIDSLGSIILRNVSIDGTYNTSGSEHDINIDSLSGRMILGDIVGATDIYVGTRSTSSIITGSIAEGSEITVAGDLNAFIVNSTTNTRGLQADKIEVQGDLGMFVVSDYGSIRTDISVDGDLRFASFAGLGTGGSYSGTLSVDGDIRVANLGLGTLEGQIISEKLSILVAGNMESANVVAEEEITTMLIRGNVVDSLILSGIDPVDDIVGNSGDGKDQLVGGSTIGNVIIMGEFKYSSILSGVSPDTNGSYNVFGEDNLAPSSTASGKINFVRIGKLGTWYASENPTNENFGIGAGTSINRLLIGRTFYTPDNSYNLDSSAGDDFYVKLF